MKNTSLLLILLLLFSTCKEDCDECKSDLITEFEYRQGNGLTASFQINYDEDDKITSIFQEGFMKRGCSVANNRLYSEDITYTYENGLIRSATADVKEIMGDNIGGQVFEGRIYKHFTTDEFGRVYEIVDSMETDGNLTYSQDTIIYGFRDDRFTTIEELKTGVVREFQYNDDENIFVDACTRFDPSTSYAIFPLAWNYKSDENPFTIFNEQLGYMKFTGIQFNSAHLYRNARYTGPSGPGQGSTITYTGELEADCHGQVVDVDGSYIVLGRLCR